MLVQSIHLKPRTAPPRLIVGHTPGSGLARFANDRAPYAVDPVAYELAAVGWYTSSAAEYYGHIVIGPTGNRYDLAPLDSVALHTAMLDGRYNLPTWREWAHPIGGKGWARHGRDPEVVWDQWDARWPDTLTPVEFIGSRSINANSIGLDYLPTPSGEYTDIQVETAAALVCELADRYGIELRTGGKHPTYVGHEDIDPLRRGAKMSRGKIVGVLWDPGSRWPRERFNKLVSGRACT